MERRIELEPHISTIVQQWGTRGPTILCVHGIASSRRSWQRLGECLSDIARVYAFDQRGHGDSAAVLGPMKLARSVDDLAAIREAIRDPIDLLIGHSWGGTVAILGGRRMLVTRVLAVDPMVRVVPGTFDGEYVDDLRETFALDPEARDAAIREMYAGAHETDVAGKLHAMSLMRIEALERLGRENEVDAGAWNVRKSVENYPVPLDILAAGYESAMSADDVRFIRDFGGANVTLTPFEHEGHNLHRTAFEAFLAIVADRAGLSLRR